MVVGGRRRCLSRSGVWLFVACVSCLLLSPPVAHGGYTPVDNDFDNWIKTLTVRLSGKNFTVGVGDLSLTLSVPEIHCTDLYMDSPGASLRSNDTELAISIHKLRATCDANWTLSNTIDDKVNSTGAVSVAITSESHMDLSLLLRDAQDDNLPDTFVANQCLIKLSIGKITFTKDDAWFLNLFSEPLKGFLEITLPLATCYEIEQTINQNGTALVQQFSSEIRRYLSPVVNEPTPPIPKGSVNFTNNDIVGVADFVANSVIGTDGILNVNTLVNEYTNNTGDIIETNITYLKDAYYNLTGDVLQTKYVVDLPNVMQANVSLQQVNISGLDQWSKFKLLLPTSAYSLTSMADAQEIRINVTLLTTIRLHDNVAVDSTNLQQTLFASFHLSNTNATIISAAAFNKSMLTHFQPDTQLQNPDCLLWATDVLNFTELMVNSSNVDILVLDQGYALRTTSGPPGAHKVNATQLFTTMGEWILHSVHRDMNALIRGYVQQDVRVLVNQYVAGKIGKNDSAYPCPDSHDESYSHIDVVSTSAAFAAAAMAYVVLVCCWGGHRALGFRGDVPHDQAASTKRAVKALIAKGWARGNRHKSVEDAAVCSSASDEDGLEDGCVGPFNGPLLLSPHIPWVAQLGVPLMAMMTIPLFISSHTSTLAVAFLKVHYRGGEASSPPLEVWTFASAVDDMWDAGVYPLALLICAFSGAWPYVKLIAILFCWLCPAWIVRVRAREWILSMIDALGKWSLLDIFIIILMSVSLHSVSHVPTPEEEHEGSVVAKVFVTFTSGFYNFLTATVLSLVIGHLAVACHHRTVHRPMAVELARVEAREPTLSISAHTLTWIPHRPVRLTKVARVLVLGAFAGAFVLAAVGIAVESFSFRFTGFGRDVFRELHTPVDVSYDTLTLIWKIGEGINDPTDPLVIAMQVVVFCFIVVVPLVFMPAAMVCWLVPIRPWMLRKFVIVLEIMYAWAALDVFSLAIFVTLAELPQFSIFILDHSCEYYMKLINAYAPPNTHIHTCLEVQAQLLDGVYVILSSAVLYNIAGLFMVHICHHVVARREEEAKRMVEQAHAVEKQQYHPPAIPYGAGYGSMATQWSDGGHQRMMVDEDEDGHRHAATHQPSPPPPSSSSTSTANTIMERINKDTPPEVLLGSMWMMSVRCFAQCRVAFQVVMEWMWVLERVDQQDHPHHPSSPEMYHHTGIRGANRSMDTQAEYTRSILSSSGGGGGG